MTHWDEPLTEMHFTKAAFPEVYAWDVDSSSNDNPLILINHAVQQMHQICFDPNDRTSRS